MKNRMTADQYACLAYLSALSGEIQKVGIWIALLELSRLHIEMWGRNVTVGGVLEFRRLEALVWADK